MLLRRNHACNAAVDAAPGWGVRSLMTCPAVTRGHHRLESTSVLSAQSAHSAHLGAPNLSSRVSATRAQYWQCHRAPRSTTISTNEPGNIGARRRGFSGVA
jgi:hypothetical protein